MANPDVIVVGAGVAGCVVARRLADAGASVLVMEAGPAWPLPAALASIEATGALGRSERFSSSVSARAGGAVRPYRLGRGVGGSSAINAMVVTSGDRADYDRWAGVRGCPGWDGEAMAPWLARAAGTVGVTEAEPGPVAAAWAAAAVSTGHPEGGASVALDARGVLTASLTARLGRRRSAADAYLLPDGADGTDGVLEPGISLRADAAVRRLTATGRRVTGVELDDGIIVPAGRVVLCAGAVGTPILLAASGLGRLAGPDVDHPGSGTRLGALVDHPSFVFTLELRPRGRQDVGRAVPPISGLLRWSSGGPDAPVDLMALAMDHVGPDEPGRRYGALIVTLTDVVSVGHVAPDPAGGILVDPGWLHDGGDRRRFRAGVRHVATLLASGSLDEVVEAVHVDDRGTPLARLAALDDEGLDRWLRHHPGPVRHPSASAAMGCIEGGGSADPAAGPVTGLDGGLAGWDAVHLADASVLPHVPNANPMLPVLAVAERLAAGLASAG